VAAGADDSALDAAEAVLGHPLPRAYRELLAHENGFERWYGEHFLMLYSLAEALELHGARRIEDDGGERHPGLFVFASDGSREMIGFDLRDDSGPVVMVDITSMGWPDALFQAGSFDDFMEQRRRAEDFRWDAPY